MGNCDSILGESSGFVSANSRGASEGLNSFEVLHEAIFCAMLLTVYVIHTVSEGKSLDT